MAKTISLNIDVAGQDELLQATSRVNALTAEKRKLNKALKEGTITQTGYDKAIAKNNVNLQVARRRANELNRELIKKSKILKDSRSFTEKLTGGLGKMALGVTAAVAGFKALTSAVGGAITAFGKQAEAETRLLTATQGNVEMTERLAEQAEKLQQVSTFGDEEIVAQQAYLASLGMTEDEINKVIRASMDLAVGTGQTLEFGVKNLAKTFGGLTGELGESLPMLKNLTKEQLMAGEAVDVVSQAFEGQAEAVAKTGVGPLKQLNNVVGDLKEKGGEMLMKFLQPFISSMVKFLPKIPGFFRNIQRQVYGLYNYFVDLYNESAGFRAIIELSILPLKNLWTIGKSVVNNLKQSFGGIGKIIKGIFTLDKDAIKEGFNDVKSAMKKTVSDITTGTQENMNKALNNIRTGTAKQLTLTEDDAEKVTKSNVQIINKTVDQTNKSTKKLTPFQIDEEAEKKRAAKALNDLKTQLLNGEITKEQFKQKEFELQDTHLQNMKALMEKYGMDVTEIDGKILDNKIKNMAKEVEEYKATDATKLEVAAAFVSALGELGDRRTTKEMEALEKQKEQGIITEEQYEKKKEAVERKAFNRKKKLDMAQVIINFAQANSKTFAQLGFPAGLAAIPVLTGLMLAQLAMIASQQFADGGLVLGDGGMFKGPSHAQGGIKFRAGGRLMEAEGGEAIINKRSSAMFRPLLSSINQAGGGVKFADGGILNGFGSSFDMAGGFNNRSEVVVVESNITDTQNTVQNIQSTASI